MTKEKVEKAIATYPTYSLSQLGKKLGISRQRVHQLIRQYNIKYEPKKNPTRPLFTKEEIQQAIQNRMSQVEFQRKNRCCWEVVNRSLTAHNISWPFIQPFEKVKLDDLKQMIEQHPDLSMSDLARHFNVSRIAILRRIQNNNLNYRK